MKLSFSTKGWHGYLWEDFTRIASEQGFQRDLCRMKMLKNEDKLQWGQGKA